MRPARAQRPNGGRGDDLLASSSIAAGILNGGGGRDTLLGGTNRDTLIDGDASGAADSDVLDGREQGAIVSYASRTAPVLVDLDDPGGDGEAGEGDVLRSITGAIGGRGADVLRGDRGGNSLDGGPGSDRLYGLGDDDSLAGGGGDDASQDWPGTTSSEGKPAGTPSTAGAAEISSTAAPAGTRYAATMARTPHIRLGPLRQRFGRGATRRPGLRCRGLRDGAVRTARDAKRVRGLQADRVGPVSGRRRQVDRDVQARVPLPVLGRRVGPGHPAGQSDAPERRRHAARQRPPPRSLRRRALRLPGSDGEGARAR